MATDMIKYRRQFIGAFGVKSSLLVDRATNESIDQGTSVVFDVTQIGDRMATRSIDGRIPRSNPTDSQVTAALTEFVKKYEVTNFEAFKSQSSERDKMNFRIMGAVNREIDYTILTELANTSTEYSGSSTAAAITLDIATKAIARLAEAGCEISPNDVTWVISPRMHAKLLTLASYTSSDYVPSKPLAGNSGQYTGDRKIKSWLDCGWIVHPNLPGVGTSSCTTYLFHRNALGAAVPTEQIKYFAGFNEEDQYYYASASLKANAKILQQAGMMKFLHNDTA
jgi:hypothetical protein